MATSLDKGIIRKINVGRITGLSAYELAVKYGFTGTEEEYVNRTNEIYNNIVTISKNFKSFSQINVDGKTIKADFNVNDLNITHDEFIDVEVDVNTRTLKFSLSEKFRNSLIFNNPDDDN